MKRIAVALLLCAGMAQQVQPVRAAWGNYFGNIPGVNGSVRSLATHGTNLYVTGDFAAAGDVTAHGIARWDGARWHAMGNPFIGAEAGYIQKIAVDEMGRPYLLVSGSRILAFEGESWRALPAPPGSPFNPIGQIAAIRSNLFAFASHLEPADEALFQWDGAAWTSLGLKGVVVRAIALAGDSLYAAGSSFSSQSVLARGFARLGPNGWESAGAQFVQIEHLLWTGERLYAMGKFRGSPDFPKPEIARWDGAQWILVMENDGSWFSTADVLARGESFVVHGGFYRNGTPFEQIVRFHFGGADVLASWPWNGSAQSYDGLAQHGSTLYFGGRFTELQGKAILNIAAWDGRNWSALNQRKATGVCCDPSALGHNTNGLYVGGIRTAGDLLVNGIARWDGTNWHALGAGLRGSLLSMAVGENEVFVGETAPSFAQATAGRQGANEPTHSLLRWDGNAWTAIATANGIIRDIELRASDVFILGEFTQLNGQPIRGLAKWNSRQFTQVGDGLPAGFWLDLALSADALFVGGSAIIRSTTSDWNVFSPFTTIGSLAGTGAVSGFAQRLLPLESGLIAAGEMSAINAVSLDNIGQWNGAWRALAPGQPAPLEIIHALAARNETDLYLGGAFQQIGGVRANNVARWGGGSWEAMEQGLNGRVLAAARRKSEVYFAGTFTQAGEQPSVGLAVWKIEPGRPNLAVNKNAAGRFSLAFQTEADTSYSVQATERLEAPMWRVVSKIDAGEARRVSLELGTPLRTAFFRVLVEPL